MTNNPMWQLSFLHSEHFGEFIDLIPEAVILSNESGEIILTTIGWRRNYFNIQLPLLKKSPLKR